MNLAVLGVCKYANFAADSLATLFGTVHQPWGIVLPLGISFFTFQKISYLVDLRRGDKHVYGLLEFAAFVTFFPQLIAGPLVRHNEIIPQFSLPPRRLEMWENLARGAVLFVIGLTKKAAIADTVAQICDPLFARGMHLNLAEAWAAAGTYTLQIYFDFFRLLGHGDRAWADVRPAPAAEFCRAVPVRLDPRVLAALAYDAVAVPARLPVHPARRQPVRPGAAGGECGGDDAAGRAVARRGLDLRRLGRAARAGAGDQFRLGPRRRAHAASAGLGADDAVRGRRLGAVPRAGFHHGRACPGGRWRGRMASGTCTWTMPGVVALAVAVVLLAPTSQDIALRRVVPNLWLALPFGAVVAFLLLLVGGRIPNEFIYFRF